MADWITTEEAVQLSGYNIQHIRKLIRRKQIAAEKKGGQYWVDRHSLLDYIKMATESEDDRRGPKRSQR
jgi:excisionase family DNA binding protein